MPRKPTLTELKNRRDYNAWKIELDGYNMTDTNKRYNDAVRELEERETERIGKLKDTLWTAAAPFFGKNITPEELKKHFEQLMNDKRNAGMVRMLKQDEEKRVKALNKEDNARIAKLKSDHSTLVEKLEKAKNKANASDTDINDTADEDVKASESDSVSVETAEIESDYYMTDPEDLDTLPEDIVSETEHNDQLDNPDSDSVLN